MFNTLANYLLGSSDQPTAVDETNTRLTSASPDDDWVLLDADSEGNSENDSDSAEILDEYDDMGNKHNQLPCLLTRSSSNASLPCTTMEESWFVTPPPCFTSAGPIHMQTSPLENLLIEHPSMSVYQHTHSGLLAHRHSVPIQFITVNHCSGEEDDPYDGYLHDSSSEVDETDLENIYEDEIRRVEAEYDTLQDRQIGIRQRYRVGLDYVQQERRLWITSMQAQKVQVHKAYKFLTPKYLQRANKARESTHNRRQRRSNYFHGQNRSNVNNNRKC